MLEDKTIHPIDLEVGERLRTARKLSGRTQTELANALGISFQQVQKYELGRNRISASKLYETSLWLGLPVAYFFEASQINEHLKALDPEMIRFAASFDKIECPELRKKIGALVTEIASGQSRDQ